MRRFLAIIRYSILVGSLLLLVFVSVCYWGRFDFCMAVTVFPPWCWAGAGVTLAALGWAIGRQGALEEPFPDERIEAIDPQGSSERKVTARKTLPGKPDLGTRIGIGLAGAWLGFLLAFADSPMSLVRGWMPQPMPAGNLRVVTFNCMSDLDAVEEVVAVEPDIVLFQESRGRAELAALGERLYGPGEHVCWGPDASIVARGEVMAVEVPREFRENFVHAQVQIGETQVDVISLRLMPSVFRIDLWSPSCWAAFQRNRAQRRRQLEKIARYLATIPAQRAVIVGGDFNAPAEDAVLRPLRSRLTDSFAVAGRGWGGTIINDWPAIRIDQLWIGGPIEAASVRARKSRFSDHRMVVGDFQVGGTR